MWRCGGRWVVGLWLPQSAARLLGQERSRHQELITNNLTSYNATYTQHTRESTPHCMQMWGVHYQRERGALKPD